MDLADKVAKYVSDIFPIETDSKRLELVKVTHNNPVEFDDLAAQKQLKLEKKSFLRNFDGQFKLIDKKTGRVLDQGKKRILSLPERTPRYAYLVDGNEYQVPIVPRLRPGIYTKKTLRGDIETDINTGKGLNFKLGMDEKTGKMTLGTGASTFAFSPVLKALGVPERKVADALGMEILEANIVSPKVADRDLLKLYKKIYWGKIPEDMDQAKAGIKKYFEEVSELDPEATEQALGKKFTSLSGDALLAASKKLLDVTRGKELPDDKESLIFKKIMTYDDFIEEILTHPKNIESAKAKFAVAVDKASTVKEAMPAAVLSNQLTKFVTTSRAALNPSQANPLEILSGDTKITLMGEGGIGNIHAVTTEPRSISPSEFGFIDPLHTAEGQMVGITKHISTGTTARDGKLYSPYYNPRSKKVESVDARTAFNSTVAMPGEYSDSGKPLAGKMVRAIKQGKFLNVPASDVDYVMTKSALLFDDVTNMIPFISNSQPIRTSFVAKNMAQAIPLKDPEAPLVQTKIEGMKTSTFENLLPKVHKDLKISIFAEEPGVVSSVSGDKIVVTGSSGEKHTYGLYDNFPLNQHSFITHTPMVSKGDKIAPKQLLADSNFSKGGTLAIGTNLKTAFIPYSGYNYEDSIVISETAAKKLTSQHIYNFSADITSNATLDLNKFVAHYPDALSPMNKGKLDGDGVIRVGERVNPGDTLIALLREMPPTPDDLAVSRIRKSLSSPFKDYSVSWNETVPGEVIDVVKKPGFVSVYVKTDEPAVVGDKLLNRSGNKGVIGKIVKDGEMPMDRDSNPFEVLLNPMGVPSRVNYSQIYETSASHIAEKQGKPYIAEGFSKDNIYEKIKDDLDKAGVSYKTDIIDPILGKVIPDIGAGKQFFLKLEHQSSKKMSARAGGPHYTMDRIPAKEKKEDDIKESSMKADRMILDTFLAHDARNLLRDFSTYTAEKNDEFWKALQTGRPLPPPKPTFAFEKMLAKLRNMGVDVERRGDAFKLLPLTDDKILEMSHGEVSVPKFVRGLSLTPEKGGLFDVAKTGGLSGKKWSHISLAEPMPNPIYKTAITDILGLTGDEYMGFVSGKKAVNKKGEPLDVNAHGAITGGKAIQTMLSNVDVDGDLVDSLGELMSTRDAAKRNRLNRKVMSLKTLSENKMKPEEFVISHIPVLPPQFRPLYPLPSGDIMVSPVNKLYQRVGTINEGLGNIAELGNEHKVDARESLYGAIEELYGLRDVTISGKDTPGAIKEMSGKEGYIRSKVLSKYQDIAGRGVVVPSPHLDMDSIGIPEPIAWKLYRPFAMKELSQIGYTPLRARELIRNKDPLARQMLENAMRKRPVILNRAPTLHKFSVLAFKPELVTGDAIKVPPVIVKGLNMDFDGDTGNLFVPVTDAAIQDAQNMFPSRNLRNPRNKALVNLPSQDITVGLYKITLPGKKLSKSYVSFDDVLNAFRADQLKVTDGVLVNGKRYTPGQLLVNNYLPQHMRDYDRVLTASEFKNLMDRVEKEAPDSYAGIISNLSRLGAKYAYLTGLTINFDDIAPVMTTEKRRIVDALGKRISGKNISYEKMSDMFNEADNELSKLIKDMQETNLLTMHKAGGKPDTESLKQAVITPLQFRDHFNKTVPFVVKNSFSEGLLPDEFFIAAMGGRKGLIEKTREVAGPGYFANLLTHNAQGLVVSMEDCGTTQGVELPTSSGEIVDRFLVEPAVNAKGKVIFPAGEQIDAMEANTLKHEGVKFVKVRSPLKCIAPNGVCAKCYGIDENRQLPGVGTNLGMKIGPELAEPLTQASMKKFHTGGKQTSKKATVDFIGNIENLFYLPKSLADKAELSQVDGTVEGIKELATGAKKVMIGGEEHTVPAREDLLVSKGDEVHRGDRLSTGNVSPQELLDLTGLINSQDFIVEELYNLYKDSGSYSTRKNFELIAKPLTEKVRVTNPGAGPWAPGEILNSNEVRAWNRKEEPIIDLPVAFSVGNVLAKDIGPVPAGKVLDKADFEMLRGMGYSTIPVKKKKVRYRHEFFGLKTAPREDDDWLNRGAFGYFKESMIDTASHGGKSPIHGFKPYPAIMYGAELGRGPHGEY